jgi:phosphoglycerate kinase
MESPKQPLVAILGGAKISDKIKVISRLVNIADHIVIGGAMANTFLGHNGIKIGKSIHEAGLDDIIENIYAAIKAKIGPDRNVEDFLTLPTDVATAKSISTDEPRVDKSVSEVQDDELILDIGPDSIEEAVRQLVPAGTVIWNGTLGYAEIEQFSYGSARVALQLAQQTNTTSVIGGGDTADFVLKWDAQKGGSFSHVSTGGGASLDLMAGEKMPGIESLMNW